MVGELDFSMYGTRDVAQTWGGECASQMEKTGFHRGTASPCTSSHPTRRLNCYINGDGFVTVGHGEDIKWAKADTEQTYELKTQVLEPDVGDSQQVSGLNRILTLANDGIGL